MPYLGETKLGREIGYKPKTNRYRWSACIACGKQRWVRLNKGKISKEYCISCVQKGKRIGLKHGLWKGGRNFTTQGYIRVYLSSADPFYEMCSEKGVTTGYILEHRLVMARALNRCLSSKEIVHHLNGIRNDNRPENLALVNKQNHQHNTLVKVLQQRIRELEV